VALGLYALHHHPELWPDPMAFDPDRFSPENVQARDRWQFLPFLGGGRPCIGEHFARLETTLALATVVRAMTVESLDDDFECEVPFTTVAKGPIRARLIPRG
jgi:cytochrome P450